MSAQVRFYGQLWKGQTTSIIRKAARETARYAVRVLKRENKATAYKTGKMASSWKAELADKGILLTNSAPYAGYVINGTKRMRARPILQRKLPAIQDKFKSELGKQIGRQLASKVIKTLDTNVSWSKLTEGFKGE